MEGLEFYIYKIECLANGKKYIGRTEIRHAEQRRRAHLSALRNNNHRMEDMQADFNKYGEEGFEFEIIEACCRERNEYEDCVDGNREKAWMSFYQSYKREFGYNYRDPKFHPRKNNMGRGKHQNAKNET